VPQPKDTAVAARAGRQPDQTGPWVTASRASCTAGLHAEEIRIFLRKLAADGPASAVTRYHRARLFRAAERDETVKRAYRGLEA